MEISTEITIEVPFDDPEFFNLMVESNVPYKTPGDHGIAFDSFMLHFFVNIVDSPYTLPSLASVCVAYVNRNKGKSLKVTQGKKIIELKGYGVDEAEKLLRSANRIEVVSDFESES